MRTRTWVVLDIEGTVSSTDQVHLVLYDYARPRLGPWIDEHPDDPTVVAAVAEISEVAGLPATATTADIVAVLHDWMARDQKAAPLKTLQGLVWQRGYDRGDLVAELFPDVDPALRSWHADGTRLAIFSSGSVAGQIAFFAHTTNGDLTPLLDHHFDTVTAGPKGVTQSYTTIAGALGAPPEEIVFYSDVPAELDAAAAAGWGTVGVARAGEPYGEADFTPHTMIRTFA